MSDHTPGPWKVDPCCDADGHDTVRRDDGSEHGSTIEQPIATAYYPGDAHRIVACVNACEGIADPEEAVPELLEALEEARRWLEDDVDIPGFVGSQTLVLLNRVDAAIAKARGTDA